MGCLIADDQLSLFPPFIPGFDLGANVSIPIVMQYVTRCKSSRILAPSASRFLSSVCHGLLAKDSQPPPPPVPHNPSVCFVAAGRERNHLAISLTFRLSLRAIVLWKCHRRGFFVRFVFRRRLCRARWCRDNSSETGGRGGV